MFENFLSRVLVSEESPSHSSLSLTRQWEETWLSPALSEGKHSDQNIQEKGSEMTCKTASEIEVDFSHQPFLEVLGGKYPLLQRFDGLC